MIRIAGKRLMNTVFHRSPFGRLLFDLSFYHAAPRDGIQAVCHSRDELQCASALHAFGKLTYTQDAAVCHDEAIHATATESPLSLQWQLFC